MTSDGLNPARTHLLPQVVLTRVQPAADSHSRQSAVCIHEQTICANGDRQECLSYTAHCSLLCDDAADAAIAQQLVKGVEILAHYLIKAAAMGSELFLKHCLHFALLRRWLEVCAGNSVGQVVDLTDQLWRKANAVLSLAGQSALDQIVFNVG